VSVSVCSDSSTLIVSTGSGTSVSVGSFAPGRSVRSSIFPPSITSGPKMFWTTCGCAGNVWIGLPPPLPPATAST